MTEKAQSSDVYRLPYEGNDTDVATAERSLFDQLGSDPEFGAETPGDPDGPAPDEASGEPADDAEGEEPEAEPVEESDEDEDEADEEAEEPDDEPRPTYKVKVDGAEVEVTLDELLSGYSRTADYTRKTQELAAQRKQVEAEAQYYRQAREQYGARLQQLDQVLEGLQPAEPDWDTLRRENPAEFAAQWAEHQRLQAARSAALAERQRLQAEQLAEVQRDVQARLAEERRRLVEAIPEWRDEGKQGEEKQALVRYAKDAYAFTDEDLGQVYDHRVMLILRKAMLYDELTAKGREAVRQKKEKPAPVLKPGGRPEVRGSPSRRKRQRALQERLVRSGHTRDAAALIETMLDD